MHIKNKLKDLILVTHIIKQSLFLADFSLSFMPLNKDII